MVTGTAQPADGVNVYVVVPAVEVLIVDGFHVPLTPLIDVTGNVGAVLFWQSGPIWANVGVTWLVITISITVDAPH
jgi:hypothetical protein